MENTQTEMAELTEKIGLKSLEVYIHLALGTQDLTIHLFILYLQNKFKTIIIIIILSSIFGLFVSC